MQTRRWQSGLVLAGIASIANGGTLQHGAISEPELVASLDAKILRIGRLTHAVENGGMLYVAGEEGVAAINADGKPQWAARLPRVDIRTIAADGSGIAFVGQQLAGVEPGAAARFMQGDLADVPTFTGTTVGLLDKGRRGAVLWTTPLETTDRAAPPGISGATVAATDGATLALFDRTTGALTSREKTFPGFFAGMKLFQGATRNAPVYANESYYVGFSSELSRVDSVTGKENWRKSNHGMMSPFINITAGPLMWGDKIVFGNSSASRSNTINDITRVFVSDLDGEQVWNDRGDKDSGIASLAVQGNRLFVASNFTLRAYENHGKKFDELWSLETAKDNGALMYSGYRGVRYYLRSQGAAIAEAALLAVFGGNDSDDMAVRIGYGNCLVADERNVYVSTSEFNKFKLNKAALAVGVWRKETESGGREVITVLDGATGRYVTTLDAKGAIIDLLLLGPNLATYDTDTIRIFRRPQ